MEGKRILNMAIAGLFGGWVGHYWYLFIDKRFVGTSLKIVLTKTLMDQLFYAPFAVVAFFLLLGSLDGASLRTIKVEIKEKGPEVILIDWIVYIPAQYVNYRFLPTRFRVLYDNVIAFTLDLYYSYIKYER